MFYEDLESESDYEELAGWNPFTKHKKRAEKRLKKRAKREWAEKVELLKEQQRILREKLLAQQKKERETLQKAFPLYISPITITRWWVVGASTGLILLFLYNKAFKRSR